MENTLCLILRELMSKDIKTGHQEMPGHLLCL